MNEHWTDEQLTEALSGAIADDKARRHLAACDECRDELARIKAGVAGFVAIMREEAGERRLGPVMPARAGAGVEQHPNLMWAIALVLLVLATWLLRWSPSPPQQQAVLTPSSDDTLLLEVQEDLYREVPEALAPALVLTAERNRIIGQERPSQNR